MPLTRVRIQYEGPIHSPFSGEPVDPEEGVNEADPSLLFVHYGNGEWSYVSDAVLDQLGADSMYDLGDPKDVAERLDIPNGLLLEVDYGWNGINAYAFAPSNTPQT